MSSISLREFIERREAEIRELRASLLLELKELKAAKLAIESSVQSTASTSDKRFQTTTTSSTSRNPTIKEMVVAVLEARNGRGNADDIKSWIFEDFQRDIARSSLSPQLSRLREDQKLAYEPDGGVWSLPPEILDTEKSEEDFDVDLPSRGDDKDFDLM